MFRNPTDEFTWETVVPNNSLTESTNAIGAADDAAAAKESAVKKLNAINKSEKRDR